MNPNATLTDVINYVQGICGSLGGFNDLPETPLENLSSFPVAVCYATDVVWTSMSGGWKKGLCWIQCEMHFSRQNLPLAIAQAMPYNELFANAIFQDPTLGNNVDTIVSNISGKFGYLPWGNVDNAHLGWTWRIQVKMETVFT